MLVEWTYLIPPALIYSITRRLPWMQKVLHRRRCSDLVASCLSGEIMSGSRSHISSFHWVLSHLRKSLLLPGYVTFYFHKKEKRHLKQNLELVLESTSSGICGKVVSGSCQRNQISVAKTSAWEVSLVLYLIGDALFISALSMLFLRILERHRIRLKGLKVKWWARTPYCINIYLAPFGEEWSRS